MLLTLWTEQVQAATALDVGQLEFVDRLRASAMSETIDAVVHRIHQPSTAALNYLAAAAEAVRRSAPATEVSSLLQHVATNVSRMIDEVDDLEGRMKLQSDPSHNPCNRNI